MKIEELLACPKHSQGTFLERFWKKVRKSENGCWEWIGSKWESGYGRIIVNGKQLVATRVMLAITNREVDDSLFVIHRCDNRGCVRPDHLRQGTPLDNARDAVERDRHSRGERNGVSRLKPEQVIEIRSGRYKRRSRFIYKMAEKFGVSYDCVWGVISGRTWRHL